MAKNRKLKGTKQNIKGLAGNAEAPKVVGVPNVPAGGALVLKPVAMRIIRVPIVGVTPVIPHNWSAKARRMMPGHPDKPDKTPRGVALVPQDEAEGCLYRLRDGRPGLPASAFKAAIVDAGIRFHGFKFKVDLKTWLTTIGEGPEQLFPVEGELELHEDMVRNSDMNRTAALRYRYYILDWRTELRIQFPVQCLTPESVVTLVNSAGYVGIGDWRPSSPKSCTGTYGTWKVDDSREVVFES